MSGNLQLDLATVVARLEQIRDEADGDFGELPIISERLLTCDLPRLRAHLNDEGLGYLAADT